MLAHQTFSFEKTNNIRRKFYNAYLLGGKLVHAPFKTTITLISNLQISTTVRTEYITNSSRDFEVNFILLGMIKGAYVDI